MPGIFDLYTPGQLREIFLDDHNKWPEDYLRWINMEIADELLDDWLESHSTEEYLEKARQIVQDFTIGYRDSEGNEMDEFDPLVENGPCGPQRLFDFKFDG